MTILVCGGAGYIGSAFVARLVDAGERAVVLDDLSGGHADALPEGVPLYVGRVGDAALVARVAAAHDVNVCVHFAGFIAVGESVADPLRYYDNNLAQGVALLSALARAGVGRVVFSSTAAVYGTPRATPIPEDHPPAPESPYGRTKLAFEQCLDDATRAAGGRRVTFRYFNAAGATARCRERHEPETHLIPNALRAAAAGAPLRVFGVDFPTRDGTAERDYVHVEDLAEAHLLAVRHLRAGGASATLNLGAGVGHTVREVIAAVERVTGRPVPRQEEGRRAGDPASLVADVSRAAAVLGWRPRRAALDDIVASAWEAAAPPPAPPGAFPSPARRLV